MWFGAQGGKHLPIESDVQGLEFRFPSASWYLGPDPGRWPGDARSFQRADRIVVLDKGQIVEGVGYAVMR